MYIYMYKLSMYHYVSIYPYLSSFITYMLVRGQMQVCHSSSCSQLPLKVCSTIGPDSWALTVLKRKRSSNSVDYDLVTVLYIIVKKILNIKYSNIYISYIYNNDSNIWIVNITIRFEDDLWCRLFCRRSPNPISIPGLDLPKESIRASTRGVSHEG